MLGLRHQAFIFGLEGAYFIGAKILGMPPEISESGAREGRLRSLRANLIGQYELKWGKFGILPTLGVGVERTSLSVDSENLVTSSQFVLFEGVSLSYELSPSFSILVDQRIQHIRFDTEWGLNYWAQIAAEFSF